MENIDSKEISLDYIRGLVEGEGCFTFCSVPRKTKNNPGKFKLPTFVIAMHERDEPLITAIRDRLKLKNRVYNHQPYMGDGIKRGRIAKLIVRDFGALKNIIVPLFYGKLRGNKGKQFLEWLQKIEDDPDVPATYKLIHRLHKSGFYARKLKLSG